MRNRYGSCAALALAAGIASSPACAETLEVTIVDEDSGFRIAPAHTPSPVLLAPPDASAGWDLNDLARATSTPYSPPAPNAAPGTAASITGPAAARDATDHVPRAYASHRRFFRQAGSVGTELAILSAYVGAQSIPKLFKPTAPFHFQDEGWFGKDTHNIGVDKLTHAYNTYLIAELLHYRIHRNTGGSEGDALTAGILAAGLMAINEMSDAIEPDSGYSMQDITMNVAGAAFSVLRNTVPGLKEKLAFKLEIVPNGQIYSHVGKKHYEQQRFMFSLKGAGFEGLERTPLKYLDLQVGYYASDFLASDRAQGHTPKRHLFVGVGLNLGELLFANSESRIGRAAYSVLDYLQVPYTSLRYDTTGRLRN